MPDQIIIKRPQQITMQERPVIQYERLSPVARTRVIKLLIALTPLPERTP